MYIQDFAAFLHVVLLEHWCSETQGVEISLKSTACPPWGVVRILVRWIHIKNKPLKFLCRLQPCPPCGCCQNTACGWTSKWRAKPLRFLWRPAVRNTACGQIKDKPLEGGVKDASSMSAGHLTFFPPVAPCFFIRGFTDFLVEFLQLLHDATHCSKPLFYFASFFFFFQGQIVCH